MITVRMAPARTPSTGLVNMRKMLWNSSVLQPSHCAAHGVHAEHEHRKSQEDRAHILLALAFGHHGQAHADQGQHGREKEVGSSKLDKSFPRPGRSSSKSRRSLLVHTVGTIITPMA